MSNRTLNILLLIGGAGLLYYLHKKGGIQNTNANGQNLNQLNESFPYGAPQQNIQPLVDYKIKIGTIKKSLTIHTI
jgi:hypothetical protein